MDPENFFALPIEDVDSSHQKLLGTLPQRLAHGTSIDTRPFSSGASYSTSDLIEENTHSMCAPPRSAPLVPVTDWGAGICSPRCATPPPPYKDHVSTQSQSAPSSPGADHPAHWAGLLSLVKHHQLRQPLRSLEKLHDLADEAMPSRRCRTKKDDGFYQRLVEKISLKLKDEAPEMIGRDISWPMERRATQPDRSADEPCPMDQAVMTPLPLPIDSTGQHRNGDDVLLFRADFRDEDIVDTAAPSHVASPEPVSPPNTTSNTPPSDTGRVTASRRRSFRSSPQHSVNLDTISEEAPTFLLPRRANSDATPRRCPDSPTLGYNAPKPQEPAPVLSNPCSSKSTRPHISEADQNARSRLKRLRKKAPAALNLESSSKPDPSLPKAQRTQKPIKAEGSPTERVATRSPNNRTRKNSEQRRGQVQDGRDLDSWFSDDSEREPEILGYRQKVYAASDRTRSMATGMQRWLQDTALTVVQGFVLGGNWLSNELQGELPLKPKLVRIRWTCKCGEQLYDDFLELQAGAARELEATLNARFSNTSTKTSFTQHAGPRTPGHTSHNDGPDSAPSSASSSVFSLSNSPTAASDTSADIADSPLGSSFGGKGSKMRRSFTAGSNAPYTVSLGARADVAWLLTCASERSRTPKVSHLNMDRSAVRSDKDLALALRAHYASLHNAWYAPLRLRGLTGVDFVQFEMHATRIVDVRARPAMPPRAPPNLHLLRDAPDHYIFEAAPLLPPVGSNYLMHLLAHPHDFEDENIALARAPKRIGRLAAGTGWGLELVEGFLAARMWGVVVCGFVLASAVFVSVWIAREGHDVQGAFAVASWVLMLAGLVFGWIQACVEQH